jgi:hypothetical protein
MKIAILMGRGIEGCGVTRYAIETQKWYHKNNMVCDIYASLDKKWPRRQLQQNNIIEFTNSEIQALSKKLNSEYDVIFYQSLPAKKGHSEDYQNQFLDYLVKDIEKPIKIAFQNDHKLQSLSRNANIWETMRYMDAAFTFSKETAFAKKMAIEAPKIPLYQLRNGFDFDSIRTSFWKPVDQQLNRITYLGRFAGFKEPHRLVEMQPLLKDAGIITELRGIERSRGSLIMFYHDPATLSNPRDNFYEVTKKNPEPDVQSLDYAYIYGPYERNEGINNLSNSMFGSNFFNLAAETYGNIIEYSSLEIIAAGAVPVLDKHWAENNVHVSGTRFADMKDFAIYSDRDDHYSTVAQMQELMADPILRNTRREACYEIAREHNDFNLIYQQQHDLIMATQKLTGPPKVLKLF